MERAFVDSHTYSTLAEAVGAATSIAEALGHQLTDWLAGSPLGSLAVCHRCGHFLYAEPNVGTPHGYVAQGAALQKLCSGGNGTRA
jgi:hypothetical protein